MLADNVVEGCGNRGGRIAEPDDEDSVGSRVDVVDGELLDASEGLGVELDEQRELLVGIVERVLQVASSERPLRRHRFNIRDVLCGINIGDDLHRVRPEAAHALFRPAVGPVDRERAEKPRTATW